MPLPDEQLIRKIVEEEVRKFTAQSPAENKPQEIEDQKIIAVLFTGTDARLNDVIAQVNTLSADFFVSLIIDPEFQQLDLLDGIKPQLKCQELLDETEFKKIETRTTEARLLLIPLLSRNTAARLALGLTDTLATKVIFNALTTKKPVLAVAGGARAEELDPELPMVRLSPSSIKNIMTNYLNTLRHWGIEFIEIGEIVNKVRLEAEPPVIESRPLTATEKPPLKRPIITRDDMLELKRRGETKLHISKDAIITSLASDYAKEEGIEIIFEQ